MKSDFYNNINFQTSILIHFGEIYVGIMGFDSKVQYSSAGMNIIIANNMKKLNTFYHSNIIINEYAYEKVNNKFIGRKLDNIAVVGNQGLFSIYELIDYKENMTDMINDKLYEWELAIHTYENKDIINAQKQFINFYKKYPYDGPCQVYISRCQELLK